MLGLAVSPLEKKLKFHRNEFDVQEQGMGGTVYDRDTIMKKYMNGYDGKTVGHKHITLLLQRQCIGVPVHAATARLSNTTHWGHTSRLVHAVQLSEHLTYACMYRTCHIYQ